MSRDAAALKLEAANTVKVLEEAAKKLPAGTPPAQLVSDSGSENTATVVEEHLLSASIRQVLALVDEAFSNSIPERLWMSLRHGHLYHHALDVFATVQRLVDFYFDQHNRVIPHAALGGRTPEEVFVGTGVDVPERLREARCRARQARIEANRAASCAACEPTAPARDPP